MRVRRPRRLQRKGGQVEVLGTAYRRHPEDAWPDVLEAGNKQGPYKTSRGWSLSIHGPRLWLAQPWQCMPGGGNRLVVQELHDEKKSGIVPSQKLIERVNVDEAHGAGEKSQGGLRQ